MNNNINVIRCVEIHPFQHKFTELIYDKVKSNSKLTAGSGTFSYDRKNRAPSFIDHTAIVSNKKGISIKGTSSSFRNHNGTGQAESTEDFRILDKTNNNSDS